MATKAKMLDLFKSAREVSVPLLLVETKDQFETVEAVRLMHNDFPLVQWDAAGGISAVNKKGDSALVAQRIKGEDTLDFIGAMKAARMLPEKAVLFAHNLDRQLTAMEPGAVAGNVQALANLREPFKKSFRMVLGMAPAFTVPPALEQDVVLVRHELPGPEELATVVRELHLSARKSQPKLEALTDETVQHAVDAVSGLSTFAAEQAVSMSFTEERLDMDALWERKRTQIEMTDGLSVSRSAETFADVVGNESIKRRLLQHIRARTPVGCVVRIDEGADVFQNVETDSSGTKTDQQRSLLVAMEDRGWRGIICVGVPGTGKSLLSRAFGNEAGVPTIDMDLGAMESKWVGESEHKIRVGMETINAIGRGHAFFILTCNSLRGIRPQFQARFRRGVFFFDLTSATEREATWTHYLRKYGLTEKQAGPRPDDAGWVPREIRECVESAWDCGISLAEAASFIVPVTRSRFSDIEAMRKEADNRFLDASRPGPYVYQPAAEPERRAVGLTASARKAMVN